MVNHVLQLANSNLERAACTEFKDGGVPENLLPDIRFVEEAGALFEGADVGLRHNKGLGETCWITLTGLGTNRTGFGEGLFSKLCIPAIYFTNFWSHWWQTPEFLEAVDFARRIIEDEGYSKLILYSASMGAYGAALLSGIFDVDCLERLSKPLYDADSLIHRGECHLF